MARVCKVFGCNGRTGEVGEPLWIFTRGGAGGATHWLTVNIHSGVAISSGLRPER